MPHTFQEILFHWDFFFFLRLTAVIYTFTSTSFSELKIRVYLLILDWQRLYTRLLRLEEFRSRRRSSFRKAGSLYTRLLRWVRLVCYIIYIYIHKKHIRILLYIIYTYYIRVYFFLLDEFYSRWIKWEKSNEMNCLYTRLLILEEFRSRQRSPSNALRMPLCSLSLLSSNRGRKVDSGRRPMT